MAPSVISVLGGTAGVTLSGDAVQAASTMLEAAERTREQVRLLTDVHPDMTMDDAYAIQAAWVEKKVAGGDPVIGWKIGLTSKAMQAALSIDIPDSGVLLGSMEFANGAEIAAGRFIQPRVEAEIAFVMRDAVAPDATPAEILAATAYVAPALEILDTRIFRKDPVSGRLRTVFDTISDNAANGGIVLGDPITDFAEIDLRWIGAVVSRNGEVEETGLGAGVLGDPLVAMAWLVQRLGAYGQRIEPGQIVLSGSFIRPVEAPPGSHIVGDYGIWGVVECHFL